MTIDLNKLKELAQAATPGPWESESIKSEGEYGDDDTGGYGYMSYAVNDDEGRCIMDCLNNDDGMVHVGDDGIAWDEVAERNAAFVAAANPAAILELIALAERASPAPAVVVEGQEPGEAYLAIGKLIEEISQLQVLWGLGEAGALVRFRDVSNILFAASRKSEKPCPYCGSVDGKHDAAYSHPRTHAAPLVAQAPVVAAAAPDNKAVLDFMVGEGIAYRREGNPERVLMFPLNAGEIEDCIQKAIIKFAGKSASSAASPDLQAGQDVRELLQREMRDAQSLASLLQKERERFEFLHSTNCDADGWEWGVARVRRAAEGRIEYLWGLSDHSDIDAAMNSKEQK